jgi:hypothetical protein
MALEKYDLHINIIIIFNNAHCPEFLRTEHSGNCPFPSSGVRSKMFLFRRSHQTDLFLMTGDQ